jgi:hypothetical protein
MLLVMTTFNHREICTRHQNNMNTSHLLVHATHVLTAFSFLIIFIYSQRSSYLSS